jgi:hypothetical protein
VAEEHLPMVRIDVDGARWIGFEGRHVTLGKTKAIRAPDPGARRQRANTAAISSTS